MKARKPSRKLKAREPVRSTGMVGRDAVRAAVAAYMRSEGCSCCRDNAAHERHTAALGRLLNVRKYKDGSGYDFARYEADNKRQPK
jgi:hypothetical protein